MEQLLRVRLALKRRRVRSQLVVEVSRPCCHLPGSLQQNGRPRIFWFALSIRDISNRNDLVGPWLHRIPTPAIFPTDTWKPLKPGHRGRRAMARQEVGPNKRNNKPQMISIPETCGCTHQVYKSTTRLPPDPTKNHTPRCSGACCRRIPGPRAMQVLLLRTINSFGQSTATHSIQCGHAQHPPHRGRVTPTTAPVSHLVLDRVGLPWLLLLPPGDVTVHLGLP